MIEPRASNWALVTPRAHRFAQVLQVPANLQGDGTTDCQWLQERTEAPCSDAAVVWRGSGAIWEWSNSSVARPIESMSVTKSIVSLAFGALVCRGLIDGLDTTVSSVFRDWRSADKESISVRHLLTHTSGLGKERSTAEIYDASDCVALALDSANVSSPGSSFCYNNRAFNLCAGIVAEVSGRPLDDFMAEELFGPLGASDWHWSRDAMGNPYAMAGLAMRAVDLARLGQLLSNDGVWHGQRLLPEGWLATAMSPVGPIAPRMGLSWWLVPGFSRLVIDAEVVSVWRSAEPGVPEAFIERLLPLTGVAFEAGQFFARIRETLGGLEEWHDNTWRRGLPDGSRVDGPPVACYAEGELGQYVVVHPGKRVVAVHQRERRGAWDRYNAFPDFVESVCSSEW